MTKPIFRSTSLSELTVDGSTMKALNIAYDEFMSRGKDIREFEVTISFPDEFEKEEAEVGDVFIVTFLGKLAPGTRGLGSANRAPGSIIYFISAEKWEIIKEQGIK